MSESEKPKVYYVRGPDALTSHGRNSYTEWYVEMAGGTLVTFRICGFNLNNQDDLLNKFGERTMLQTVLKVRKLNIKSY
ncbi:MULTISPECIES: hypothetical protein [Clostridium]|uniref:Uncharacterized protein n=3 Tax=Clostridium TaxID=1485 RepID=D8GUB9_CLOLD|nr:MULTISPECIES: hypothetical protein [Clostridium]ADK14782.1 hypothetical protein CLJU_c17190 [Clostridium ljungdahlii DSM 13528]AGY78032.1 hypothetical protein CAETHG_3831 [Clostridium autoethanogenum DSM 10061]ALU38166.1 Hypothetical protein CLAU_3739 [Clostridium autoethanogenum DSM 10061]OAA85982.1 hypothetical protein WX45_00187 [Clostridium ljungdahlii DSM 13528]OVY50930.1 hypothetical protein WX72_02091 [Clostridium autoethanogenum]